LSLGASCILSLIYVVTCDVASGTSHSKKQTSTTEKVAKEEGAWLAADIRVKIISRKLAAGRLHLKKVSVISVLEPKKCEVYDPESKQYFEIRQKYLETVIPSVGKRVAVLVGENRGQRGKVVEKDRENNMVSVLLDDTPHIAKLHFDHVSELA